MSARASTQRSKQAFAEEPDVLHAVEEMARPVRQYAEMTRRLAEGRFSSQAERSHLSAEASRTRNLIEARATSAGVVPAQMQDFWDAACAAAKARFGGKVEIYAVTPPREAKPKLVDVAEQDLIRQIIELEDRLAAKRAKLAAHRAGKVAA